MSVARLSWAKRRSRRRSREAGATMFIVAITLGLLATLGVYALSATASEVASAGHMRSAMQARSAAEHAVSLTAEAFNPTAAKGLVEQMTGGTNRQTVDCRTAKPYTGEARFRNVEACIRFSEADLQRLAAPVNPWQTTAFTADGFFAPRGSAPPPFVPFIEVEVANPLDVPAPPGFAQDAAFASVTVSVFVEMRRNPVVAGQANVEAMMAGKGRITIGPLSGPLARYTP